MEGLVQPDRPRTRIDIRAEEDFRLGNLPPNSGNLLEAVPYCQELPRADAVGVVGTGDLQTRHILSALIEKAVLVSDSARSRCVSSSLQRWTPGLFPEKTSHGWAM